MIAAPFFGEFGWEVSLWAPWLRWKMQRHHPHNELTVLCRPGHEYLYEDFAKQVFVRKPPGPVTSIDCQNCWVSGQRITHETYKSIAKAGLGRKQMPKGRIITPYDLQTTWETNEPPHLGRRGSYHAYGKRGNKHEGWVAVHVRACPFKQPERDWPMAKWEELIEALHIEHVIAVGSLDGSLRPPFAEDFRGRPLRDVCDALAWCQVIVGPSSGPLALAMLCGTPVVWWSPNIKDESRFDRLWNPFGVRQQKVENNWDPDPVEVEYACRKFL